MKSFIKKLMLEIICSSIAEIITMLVQHLLFK